MPDIHRLFSEFTPGAYGILSLNVMFALYLFREWRETRKLSADDRLARREGYARQVEMLTGENRSLLADQRNLREEYDRYRKLCHEETTQLREQVTGLEDRLSAVLRKASDLAIRAARGEIDPNAAELIIGLAAAGAHPEIPPMLKGN